MSEESRGAEQMEASDLAEGCVCGGCDAACLHRMFKPCCGACVIDSPFHNGEDPAAFWARVNGNPVTGKKNDRG
jgi:hypothetical protein